MPKTISIGESIRARRTARGMSQADLAEVAKIHPNTLARIERGETGDGWTPTEEILGAIEVALTSDKKRRKPKPKKAHKIGRPEKGVVDWSVKFLAAVRAGKTVVEATRAAGVNESMPYKREKFDEEFRKAWRG